MLSQRLRDIRRRKGFTLDALAKAIGTSRQTVHRYENGTIENVPPQKIAAIAEALDVTPASLMGWEEDEVTRGAGKRLPILGRIACGMPILANEERGEFVTVSEDTNADFCLVAQGDSMIGARILDGDTVMIRSQVTVENGQIAAVVVDDEATLKRVYFYPDEQKLILSPENPKYAPMVFVGEEMANIRILGRATGFISRIV